MLKLGCLWSRPRLERHIDGALGPWVKRRVQAHLVACPDCRSRADDVRRTRTLVQSSAMDVAAPDWTGFWPGIQARIVREEPRPVRDAWWLPLWRPCWGHPRLALGGALAAGLALAVFLWPGTDNQSSVAWAGPVIVQDV